MERFRRAQSLYQRVVNRDGSPTEQACDFVARSYDDTFVILGLVTWNKISPSIEGND